MRAAVYRGQGQVRVEEVPIPALRPDDVLLEVSHCGVCGSDLHFMVEDWAADGSIHGHEYSGVIAATGAEVVGWSIGAPVVGGPAPGCGRCEPCGRGATNLCVVRPPVGLGGDVGAFAEFKALPARSLFAVPSGLDLRTAALTEPLAVALRGVRRAAVEARSRVLVLGGGPIGLLTVAALRMAAVEDVTVSEPTPGRRQAAAAVGARATICPEELAEPSLPMDLIAAPFDAVIDTSGRADAMTMGLTQLARGGRLVLSGTGMKRPRFDPNRIILNELVVTGSFEYDRADFADALAMLASGDLPINALIEQEDVALADLGDALRRLASGEAVGKVLVAPHA
ncbi:MAG: zinc-dependent alcohol dehydrogenase family protein [Acidimicrobiales bacterium]